MTCQPLATLTDHELDSTIAHLRGLNRHAFLDYALTVGQYLVDRFFHGRFDAVHDRDPNKQHSFNELMLRRDADLQELGMTAASLRRYMAAAEVAHELPEQTRRQLGLDHMTKLAAVADTGERKRLAHDAATLKWTRSQVAIAVREVKTAQRRGKAKPGPKLKPQVLKLAGSLHAAARKLVRLHGAATQLGDKHRAELLAEVQAVRAALAGIV